MLDSLIAQCNRYLLECRQGASGLHLHIPSSGEFYNGANSIIPYSAPSFSSGIFYNAGAKNINAEKYP
ncbi:MAG: hypothetical protein LBH93_02710 [Chitinispirillales bacterium]|jgi:hypothetical protein|nr:hypothetical protein [Chitinispirillales bacterium]